ncbi:MAG: DUF3536 domain-containing protein, partial [Acidobacteriota bacterium]
SLFESYAAKDRIYCYEVEREDFRLVESGKMRLALGRARLASEVTGESAALAFGSTHLGNQSVHGGVRSLSAGPEYERLVGDVLHAFSRGDVAEVVRRLDAGFGQDVVSLKTLFRDEQRRILRSILESTREEAEEMLREIHERHLPLMRFLSDLGSPLPRVLRATAEFVTHRNLRQAFESEQLDPARIQSLLDDAARDKIPLDTETLEYVFRQRLDGLARDFSEAPEDASRLERLRLAVDLARRLPFEVRLWRVQNAFWAALQTVSPTVRARAEHGDRAARAWMETFKALGRLLSVRMPEETAAPA